MDNPCKKVHLLGSVIKVFHHMQVNPGRFKVLVSQQLLDLTEINPGHQQVGGKTVPVMPNSA